MSFTIFESSPGIKVRDRVRYTSLTVILLRWLTEIGNTLTNSDLGMAN